jgi:hypothetical protein
MNNTDQINLYITIQIKHIKYVFKIPFSNEEQWGPLNHEQLRHEFVSHSQLEPLISTEGHSMEISKKEKHYYTEDYL